MILYEDVCLVQILELPLALPHGGFGIPVVAWVEIIPLEDLQNGL